MNRIQERIINALRGSKGGKTTFGLYCLFSKHIKKGDLHREIEDLIGQGILSVSVESTPGRPKVTYFLKEFK